MEKIYITKYALTGGIKEIEANITTYSTSDGKGTEYAREPNSYGSFIIGKEAFRSLEDAIKNAEERRQKKIVTLKKQVEKLEKLSFKLDRD